MWRDPMHLRDYSTQQLLEEMARRARNSATEKPAAWCHDCTHFVAWCDKVPAPRKDCPDTYNPCTKGHTMRFMAPEGYPDGDDCWGFYMPVCADRAVHAPPDLDQREGAPE
jgi:hypothetical protein